MEESIKILMLVVFLSVLFLLVVVGTVGGGFEMAEQAMQGIVNFINDAFTFKV